LNLTNIAETKLWIQNFIDTWVFAASVRSIEVYDACFENMDKFFTVSRSFLNGFDLRMVITFSIRQGQFERLLIGFPYRTYPEAVRLHRAKAILTLAKLVGSTEYFTDIMAGLDDDIREEKVDTIREILEEARTLIPLLDDSEFEFS